MKEAYLVFLIEINSFIERITAHYNELINHNGDKK